MAIDKNKHLADVLETHRMKHVENFVKKLHAKKDEIDQKLCEHYGNKKYSGFKSGSLTKYTATNIKFDLDVVEPFKHDSFNTYNRKNQMYNFSKPNVQNYVIFLFFSALFQNVQNSI